MASDFSPHTVLTQATIDALRKLGIPADVEAGASIYSKPENPEHGDLATNIALVAAKSQRKNPVELARAIVQAISLPEEDAKYLSEPRVAGAGFINYSYSNLFLHEELRKVARLRGDYGGRLARPRRSEAKRKETERPSDFGGRPRLRRA